MKHFYREHIRPIQKPLKKTVKYSLLTYFLGKMAWTSYLAKWFRATGGS